MNWIIPLLWGGLVIAKAAGYIALSWWFVILFPLVMLGCALALIAALFVIFMVAFFLGSCVAALYQAARGK